MNLSKSVCPGANKVSLQLTFLKKQKQEWAYIKVFTQWLLINLKEGRFTSGIWHLVQVPEILSICLTPEFFFRFVRTAADPHRPERRKPLCMLIYFFLKENKVIYIAHWINCSRLIYWKKIFIRAFQKKKLNILVYHKSPLACNHYLILGSIPPIRALPTFLWRIIKRIQVFIKFKISFIFGALSIYSLWGYWCNLIDVDDGVSWNVIGYNSWLCFTKTQYILRNTSLYSPDVAWIEFILIVFCLFFVKCNQVFPVIVLNW
jgi:hypothetical protein